VDSGIECTLSKFVDDTRLCGTVSTLEGRSAILRDLDRLERWACADIMKFSNAKCNHKCRLGGKQIKSSSEENHRIVWLGRGI